MKIVQQEASCQLVLNKDLLLSQLSAYRTLIAGMVDVVAVIALTHGHQVIKTGTICTFQ